MSTVAGYHAQPVPPLFYFVSFLFRIRFVFQFFNLVSTDVSLQCKKKKKKKKKWKMILTYKYK